MHAALWSVSCPCRVRVFHGVDVLCPGLAAEDTTRVRVVSKGSKSHTTRHDSITTQPDNKHIATLAAKVFRALVATTAAFDFEADHLDFVRICELQD